MPDIQVFIATHNRPLLVVKAVSSVLNQSIGSFDLIVSDNSTNDETKLILSELNDQRIKYIRRETGLTAIDHLNLILNDITSDFFMIFHDDDLMHYDMLETLYGILSSKNEIVAVGANANVMVNNKLTSKTFHNSLKTDIIIDDREKMIDAYSKPGFVPFPGYLYKRIVAEKLRFIPAHGGKHCDIAFVIDLLSLGSIMFVAKPLMDYNLHENQDSRVYDFQDNLKLISYIRQSSNLSKNNRVLERLRIQNIYGELKYLLLSNKISLSSKRYFHLALLLFKYSPIEYFPKIIYLTIHSKLLSIGKL